MQVKFGMEEYMWRCARHCCPIYRSQLAALATLVRLVINKWNCIYQLPARSISCKKFPVYQALAPVLCSVGIRSYVESDVSKLVRGTTWEYTRLIYRQVIDIIWNLAMDRQWLDGRVRRILLQWCQLDERAASSKICCSLTDGWCWQAWWIGHDVSFSHKPPST